MPTNSPNLVISQFKVTNNFFLKYFNFKPCFKLRWRRARDLFGSQIPVTTGEFELRISCIQSSYTPQTTLNYIELLRKLKTLYYLALTMFLTSSTQKD